MRQAFKYDACQNIVQCRSIFNSLIPMELNNIIEHDAMASRSRVNFLIKRPFLRIYHQTILSPSKKTRKNDLFSSYTVSDPNAKVSSVLR